MLVEFQERILDISEEERYHMEEMNIQLKDKRYKWRRIALDAAQIFAVKEINETSSILEFYDGALMTVKGSYDTIVNLLTVSDESQEDTV